MLIAENLIKSFYRNIGRGRREEFNAVDGISLKAAPGEIVGILGHNGAGKTTLLRMLSSLGFTKIGLSHFSFRFAATPFRDLAPHSLMESLD